jgi:hypothetical protein
MVLLPSDRTDPQEQHVPLAGGSLARVMDVDVWDCLVACSKREKPPAQQLFAN